MGPVCGLPRAVLMRTKTRFSIEKRAAACLLAVGVGLAHGFAASAQVTDDNTGSAALGERIYREGILPSGELLQATVNGDVPIRGKVASCAQCHRNSGFGSDEPGKIVPPITGPRLFSARSHDRGEEIRSLYQEPQTAVESTQVRIPKNRPPYSPKGLLESLRHGRDSAGRTFGPLKPRYGLTEADGRHLVAYLQTLGACAEPGVDDDTMHFATIITSDVPPEQKRAYLEVIERYVETKNRETARYQARPGISPNYKNDLLKSYRRWKIHVWELEGTRDMYPLQLVSHYERTPVFAILGGLSAGDWKPIHRFCEYRGIPCLFPQTPWPEREAAGGYTIYFDRGVHGETSALVKHLAERGEAGDSPPSGVELVYRKQHTPPAFLANLQRQLQPLEVPIDFIELKSDGSNATDILGSPGAVPESNRWMLLCLKERDVRLLMQELPRNSAGQVFLSSSLLGFERGEVLADELGAHLLVPYESAASKSPRYYRVRSWFHSRQIRLTEPALQMKTYFMLSVTSHALGHMVERHSRDYLLERIEHEAENALNPGVFARLSLGPGQRFAAGEGHVISLE
jgi:hypothetical protein